MDQLPAVGNIIISFRLFTYFKFVYLVTNVPEPFTFKIFTQVVNESRIHRLHFHLNSSQSEQR